MSIVTKGWIFLIIFYACFSFTLLYTKEEIVPWTFFDKNFLNINQMIEFTCAGLDKLPDFTTIKVPNPQKHILIKNCTWNKTYFNDVMEIFGNQKIVKLQMKGTQNSVDVFEDGYFANLKALNFLDITETEIRSFNETAFGGIKSVNYLNISHNELESLTSNTFKSMQKLRNLYLDHNQLQHLPDDIFNPVYGLYKLKIDFNCLTNLTRNLLQNLTNLKVLGLGDNRIAHLSDDVFQGNKHLEKISLSNNIIHAFPERMFANNTHLKKVLMSNASADGQNNIPLPKNLFITNRNLEILHLDSNNLKTLPDELFSSLVKLRTLKLSNNKLTTLNETIFENNSKLEELYLDDNNLSQLESNIFGSLHDLTVLNLQNNQLKTLDPEVFSSLTKLVTIYLANNEVNMTGPRPNVSNLYNCVNIQNIHLSNNSVTRIYSDWFNDHASLKELDLSFNRVDQKDNVLFKSRNIQVNLTSNIYFNESLSPGKTMHERDNFLFLQLNNVGKYCPVSCACWQNIEDEEFIVWDCRQVHIPSVKQFLHDLKERIKIIHGLAKFEDVKVILSNNGPDALYLFKSLFENIHLTFLSLANSNLINLDDLSVLPDLKVLELHNNSLTTLSQDSIEKLKNMKDLNRITLHENPWTCNCHKDMRLFVKFLNSSSNLISNEDDSKITCNNTGMLVLEWYWNNPDPCGPTFITTYAYAIIYAIVSSVCSITITWSCYRFRNEIKVRMFSHKMTRWLVTEKEIDRDKIYDAFVSYSHLDEWFVCNELVPELEGGPNPYKLCIHYRDWLGGAHIPTQIHASVRDSKRTIIVLSPNFLTSFWAKVEFHEAYIKAMKERCPRLIVILLRDIGDQVKIDEELKVYLRTYTYIKWRDPRFWAKLKYALPHKQMSKA